MLVLVFAGVFIVIISALTGYIFAQNKLQFAKENREKALHIAEAGLNYYKWRLAHYPDDLEDGTGESGPYEHAYYDPEGDEIGTFSLEIDGNQQCGSIRSIDITSTGSSKADPTLTRVVSAKYARPTIAEYALILNSNVWSAQQDILGRFHSNGGIRMDANNLSLVTSAVSSWTCTSTFGCSPDSTQAGIFGTGNNDLWSFPKPQIDFAGITTDLVQMKTLAQSSGVYFADSGAQGYRIALNSNGTFDIFRVDSVTGGNTMYSSQWGWEPEYDTISSETYLQTYTPPADCMLVFVEDKLWLGGTVAGKLTIASADLVDPNVETDVILRSSIDYTTLDGTDGVTVIAEEDILIPPDSPDFMTLRGIYIAQTGHFGRNYFATGNGYSSAQAFKNTLTMNGTIVSNGRTGTKWLCPNYCSGYETRANSYDSTQGANPPPLTPYTSQDYKFVLWREGEL